MRSIQALVLGMALVAAAVAATPLSDLSVFGYQPKASAGATVVSGNARFTVLSPYLIRMEYASNGTFEDRATLAIVNRAAKVPSFTQSTSNGVLTIKTSYVTVNYHTGQAFSQSSLTATTSAGANWYFGQADNGNLLGTIKSLDLLCNPTLNCNDNANTRVHSESLHCTWGVISKNGWAVYDDTANYLMETDWFDNAARATGQHDIYFFGHGTNFKAAVKDLNTVAGKQPLTHKNLYGSWYTRWFDFDNDDIQKIIQNYQQTGLPLDTLILDMNWHKKDSWTGFSWDKELYPIPNDTVSFVHSSGLKLGANLHDAVGFGSWEDKYSVMADAVGIDPSSGDTVPFMPLNKTYMHTMEDQVLTSLGFDVWWIDWQQGGNYGGCDGEQMNPTFITDHVRSTDSIRRGENKRDQILARWGGMGTQRYPVGFSGDVNALSWECMMYQPYFVATAANVNYGAISNDLVGPANDHELHVRWMQFGAYSPVLRIHDRGMSSGGCWADQSCAIVNMWLLPFEYLEPIRAAMLERSALQPYIYTAQRQAFDDGLVLVRPMYYEFPTQQGAYSCLGPNGPAQYMFGDDMFVSLITNPANTPSGLIQLTTWIPPGVWYDDVFGELVTGPIASYVRQYLLNDVPRFMRAGAVIPRLSTPSVIGIAGQQYKAVDWSIYPGATSGAGTMYEDDGESLDYVSGAYAKTLVTFTTSGLTYTITVHATNGTFANQPSQRNVRIMLVGVPPLSGASVSGTGIPYVRFPQLGQLSHTYEGRTGTAVIDLGSQSTSTTLTITAELVTADTSPSMTSRMKLYSFRTRIAKRVTDDYQLTPFETVPGPGNVKQSAARAGFISAKVAESPLGAVAFMGTAYLNLINAALGELDGNPGPTPLPSMDMKYLLQLYDYSRGDMVLCGSVDCIYDNGEYQVMWIEGWQPKSGDGGQTKLYDYYSENEGDNWATTQSTPPLSGYSASDFSDGMVFNAQSSGANRNCLTVWWLSSTGDHMTIASEQGQQWATEHGYKQVNGCEGYVYASDPTFNGDVADAPAPSRDELQQFVNKVVAWKRMANNQKGAVQQPPTKKKSGGKKQKKLGGGAPGGAVEIAQHIYMSMTG